ncbi:MAG: RecX family transcriptional regulator [Gemella sp.]|nr:RecX family transcriptional regulator [Gemella sp.]
MKISSITKLKKLYKVTLENKDEFYLHEDTLIKYNFFKNKEVTEQELIDVQVYDKNESAFTTALNYLSYGMKSEYEIGEYLLKKEYLEENIVFAIKKLRKHKYIDDFNYAQTYTRDRFLSKLKGPEYIRKQLKEKKIQDDYIEKAIIDICISKQVNDNVYRLISKEFNKSSLPENKKIQKITTKLYTNGYSFDIIKSVFTQFLSEHNSEETDKLIIVKYYEKAYSKLSRKYDDKYKLKQKIIEKLMRDGFSYDDIKDYLSQIEF